MRHGHENFLGEFLVGVCRHSIGQLHPSKYLYENPTHGELDRRSRRVPQASSQGERASPPPPLS
jgi:hypothetical protein